MISEEISSVRGEKQISTIHSSKQYRMLRLVSYRLHTIYHQQIIRYNMSCMQLHT